MVEVLSLKLRRSWRDHVLALGALIVLIVCEFHSALNAALQVWLISPTYSHCFLIIPIAAWLIWEKRSALAKIEPVVSPAILFMVPVILLIWWFGELSAINEVRQYAVIALIQIMIFALLGEQVIRVIWFPVLFLFFLVPTGEYLIFPMQRFAARFVDVCLNLLAIPHYTEGTTFELTNGRFEIAEACAGLRFLVATVTLGVLFVYLMYRKTYKVLLFLFASVVVPLIANGLRCVGIILLAHFTSNKYGVGADHIVYGWGFNVAILLILMVLGSRFRDDSHDPVLTSAFHGRHDKLSRLMLAATTAAILVSGGPALAWWHDFGASKPDFSAIAQYLKNGGWQITSSSEMWMPHFPGADAQVLMSSPSPAAATPVNLFIGYYAKARGGHTVTAHMNLAWDESAWHLASNGVTTATLGQRQLRLQEWLIISGTENRLVWSTYWVDGQFTLSPLAVKLLQAKGAFEGRDGQAFIALSTPVDGPIEDARQRLANEVSMLGRLPSALAKVELGTASAHGGVS